MSRRFWPSLLAACVFWLSAPSPNFQGLNAQSLKTQSGNAQSGTWQREVERGELPLLGHRNWILVVDSAYPLQVSPGVETIETGADQLTVLREVLQAVSQTKHVRPLLFEDQELTYVPRRRPGVDLYRSQLDQIVGQQSVQRVPHEQIISKIDQAGKTFRVLILKTTLAIPYTSVFIQLDCEYWGADAEQRLRKAMKDGRK